MRYQSLHDRLCVELQKLACFCGFCGATAHHLSDMWDHRFRTCLEPLGTAWNHAGFAHSCPAGRIIRLLYVQPYYRIEIHNATHDDTLVFNAGAADECQRFCVVAPWTDLQGVHGIQASLRMSSKAPSKYTKTAYDTRPY